MTQDRFKEIKSQIPSSLQMMMDQLKRYLEENRAAAIVGAGFSRNAMMNEASAMKDWNQLGLDFFKRLYGHAPTEKEGMFLSPIHLAAEVEASFGRYELDNLIMQSLPDEVVIPSKLHEQLMSLNWRDIFTTNYDTLLERAYLQTERPYTVVTNKDTLLYSKHPRIVKLHGSFPNIHPFIITEEDFRTYPLRYPEFVNTVRQALIENLFCMIGFSGDDPNFKSWLGWLRDVMGKQIAPVYLITFDRNLHNAKRKLYAAQNIDIMNLAELPEIKNNIQEAFEFLFRYLNEPVVVKWTGAVSRELGKLKTAQDIVDITNEMAAVHRSYPGWLTLPKDYYDNFHDIDHDIIGFDLSKIEGIDVNSRVDFLYELNWRQKISQSPIGVDWFVTELTELPFASDDYKDDTPQKVIDLKLSLLTYYRRRGAYTEYDALLLQITERSQDMRLSQIRWFYYDQCLKAASLLEYDDLMRLLSQWNIAPTDYVGAIWKSSITYELGRGAESATLLNMAMQHLNIAILSKGKNDDYLRSCKTVMHKLQRIYSWATGKDTEQPFNPYKTVDYFKSELLRPRKDDGASYIHHFNVGHTDRSYHFGSMRFIESYLYSYRYFALCESCGFSFGTHGLTIDKENNTFFLNPILSEAYIYASAIMVRSCTEDYVKDCVTRNNLTNISTDTADTLFSLYLGKAQQLSATMNEALKERLLRVVIPLLSRLCVKASLENVKAIVPVHFKVYQHFNRHFKDSDYTTLYNNMPLSERIKMQADSLELPIVKEGHFNRDIPQRYDHLDQLQLSDVALQIIKDGLSSDDDDIQRNAFYRAMIAMHSNISPGEKYQLEWRIYNWRNTSKAEDLKRESYLTLNESPVHGNLRERLIQEDLSRLEALNVENIKSSETFSIMCRLLDNLAIFHDKMTQENHQLVISKFITMVQENERLLSKDDSQELFGGFHEYMTKVIRSMEGYLYKIDMRTIPREDISRLSDIVFQLKAWNFRYLSMLVLLSPYDKRLKEAEIKKEVEDHISNEDTFMDALQALVFLSKRTDNIQSLLQSIIKFCQYSTSSIVHHWLNYIKFFIWQGLLKDGCHQDVLKMLRHIYNNVESVAEDADLRNDILVYASRVAGAAAQEWGDSTESNLWKEIASNKDVFNEVRYSFEYGYEKDLTY